MPSKKKRVRVRTNLTLVPEVLSKLEALAKRSRLSKSRVIESLVQQADGDLLIEAPADRGGNVEPPVREGEEDPPPKRRTRSLSDYTGR